MVKKPTFTQNHLVNSSINYYTIWPFAWRVSEHGHVRGESASTAGSGGRYSRSRKMVLTNKRKIVRTCNFARSESFVTCFGPKTFPQSQYLTKNQQKSHFCTFYVFLESTCLVLHSYPHICLYLLSSTVAAQSSSNTLIPTWDKTNAGSATALGRDNVMRRRMFYEYYRWYRQNRGLLPELFVWQHTRNQLLSEYDIRSKT